MLKKKTNHYDIAIIGGGHGGLTTLCLLAQAGFKVACIDTEDPKTFKSKERVRTTAISYGSAKVIEKTGVWGDLLKKSCPIKDIQIMDGSKSPVLLEFLSDSIDKEAFGWIIDNNVIKSTLFNKAKKNKNAALYSKRRVTDFKNHEDHVDITLDQNEKITASLLIGADGRGSFTRKHLGLKTRHWAYDQTAVVCFVNHAKPHNNVAIEHFFKEGPFAILPLPDDKKGKHWSSIVWSEEDKAKKSILSYDEDTFLLALKTRFPAFYGDILACSGRLSYPLTFLHAEEYIAPRCALIADAAHGIHPIAGQGLNIGLRDIDALTTLLIDAKNTGNDWSSDDILNAYQKQRRIDNMAMAGATDNLNSLFASSFGTIKMGRKVGLRLINKIKPAREFFMRRAMGDK